MDQLTQAHLILLYLSTLPNFVVMAASDEAELVKMINTSVEINDKPSAFRYPRGNGIGIKLPSIKEVLEIGKARIIQEGKKVVIKFLEQDLRNVKKHLKNFLQKELSVQLSMLDLLNHEKKD